MNWVGANNTPSLPTWEHTDLNLGDYIPRCFSSLKITQGGYSVCLDPLAPYSITRIACFKKKKETKKTSLSCVLTHCDVSRTPRLNYSFAFNQESCIILYVIHHCFPTAQKTEWQQYTQWASTWGALNLSIISIVLRKILLCGKSRMELPFQWPAEALKLFPIKCANSEATEFSYHLICVLRIWFGLNQKIYLFILNTKWLLDVLHLTLNCIQTLKFNLCEINELMVSLMHVFNQKITFGVLESILIKVY